MRSITLFLVLAGTAVAHAQPTDPAPTGPTPADPAAPAAPTTTERVTLPEGRVLIRAAVELELSKGAAFDKVSLSPDVWYGVDNKLTIGLVHSAAGSSGVVGGVGSSLCFTSDTCDVYHNVGIDARYHLKDGKLTFAGEGGLYVGNFDPFQLAVKLGIVGRYRPSPTSKLAVDITPNLVLGLTSREPEMGTGMNAVEVSANQETLALPVMAWYAVIPKLSVGLQVAFVAPLETAGDSFVVPVSIGGSYQVSERIVLNLAFTLPAVAGGSEVKATGVDARSLTLGGSYAL